MQLRLQRCTYVPLFQVKVKVSVSVSFSFSFSVRARARVRVRVRVSVTKGGTSHKMYHYVECMYTR